MELEVKVNGEQWMLNVAPADVLLDVLREHVGTKSTKIGCERGDCGSCTILMDGRTVRSCLVLAVEAEGHEIVTVEGISYEGLSELQNLFLRINAFQCGFCAPGIVLSATELLEHNPNPTRHDVQEALAGNLCRCTGYEPIIEAVLAAGRPESGPGQGETP
ncbi:MAG: (2Fe-2S)-binding protein [Acidimicrobiia bacterium]|nr:(2Fe-2S)-binding protein [Acidimicrobiia bacterium]